MVIKQTKNLYYAIDALSLIFLKKTTCLQNHGSMGGGSGGGWLIYTKGNVILILLNLFSG